MLVSTEAIVLRHTAYTSSSFIVNAYSKDYGLIAFMLRQSKKSKTGVLKELLSIVEISYILKEKQRIITPKKINLSCPLPSITLSFHKQCMVVFLAELLSKVIQEEEPNIPLYNFIRAALVDLDATEDPSSFHVWFMAKLARFLGVFPNLTEGVFLDLESGKSIQYEPAHNFYLNETHTSVVKSYGLSDNYMLSDHNWAGKSTLLNQLLSYYKIHVDGFKDLKSMVVLESIYAKIKN